MRLDVIKFKKTQSGKTFAIKLGSALQNKDGISYTVYLDSMPAPEDGQFQFSIVPPRDSNRSTARAENEASVRDDLGNIDDEIPF